VARARAPIHANQPMMLRKMPTQKQPMQP